MRKLTFSVVEWMSNTGVGELGMLIKGWWDEINDWQDGFFFTLSALFALVSMVALVRLIRNQLRVPEFKWSTPKVFHFMYFIVFGVRAVVFGLHNQVFILNPKVLRLVLLDLPGLLLISTDTILALFWTEIYNMAKNLPTDKLRPLYLSINAGVYFIQIIIWIFLWLDYHNGLVQLLGRIFIAVVSIVAALFFLVSGGRLMIKLRQVPTRSTGRTRKIFEIGTIMTVCITCSLIQCLLAILSALKADTSLDTLDHPIMNLFYYMIVEILPSALILFILRK